MVIEFDSARRHREGVGGGGDLGTVSNLGCTLRRVVEQLWRLFLSGRSTINSG